MLYTPVIKLSVYNKVNKVIKCIIFLCVFKCIQYNMVVYDICGFKVHYDSYDFKVKLNVNTTWMDTKSNNNKNCTK